jgi:hypothetical protein
MISSWQTETGQLVCHWSDVGRPIQYNPLWMQSSSDMQSGYLPPYLNFASRSPFGGAFGCQTGGCVWLTPKMRA